MRSLGMFVVLIFSSQVFGQMPAQRGVSGSGNRPTRAPQGKTVKEETKSLNGQYSKNKTVMEDGRKIKKSVACAITDVNYMMGIRCYGDGDGVVLISTMKMRDKNQANRLRCAAEEVMVDFLGNGNKIKVRLEPGDKVLSIDGYDTDTPETLGIILNSASNPHDLEIRFIDWRTGNEYVGNMNAMKVK